MPARLLIFKLFSRQHALILHSVFIYSNIFDQKYQKFMFFRLQYAHFWALILVSIKFSRRHVYYFHKLFQQACLFWQARLFRTLEYIRQSTFDPYSCLIEGILILTESKTKQECHDINTSSILLTLPLRIMSTLEFAIILGFIGVKYCLE